MTKADLKEKLMLLVMVGPMNELELRIDELVEELIDETRVLEVRDEDEDYVEPDDD